MRLHLDRLIPVAVAALLLTWQLDSAAQPVTTQLPVLRSGGAQINATITTPATATMNITQSASTGNRALVEWNTFSIGSAAKVNIIQPNAQSVLVNRVVGAGITAPIAASEIYGAMNANGRVFLVNPTGIVFGPGAQVNVGSLVATTLDLASAMTANNYDTLINGSDIALSTATGSQGTASLQVLATTGSVPQIQVADNGSIVLLSRDGVSQSGIISAPKGTINISTAQSASVLPVGQSGFVELSLVQPVASAGNLSFDAHSQTLAAGGSIVVGTQGTEKNTRSDSISIAGQLSTDSSTGAAGSVSIDAGTGGNVSATEAAVISSNTTAAGNAGGQVSVHGGTIALNNGDVVDPVLSADGVAGGGSVTVGGTETRSLRIDNGVIMSADATGNGNGGSVVARATFNNNAVPPTARTTFGVAEVYGQLRARGGPHGGAGGHIETSGAALTTALNDVTTTLVRRAVIDASARAAGATAGTWTFDPYDVTISNTLPTSNANGQFNPTAPGAIIQAGDLSNALNAGTDITISTQAGGAGTSAGNITFASGTSIQRTTGTAATNFTLQANNNIAMTGSSIASSAGPINVRFISDSDGNGTGGISFTGSIGTAGGSLTLAGGTDPAAGFATSTTGGVVLGAGTIDTRGVTVPGTGDVVIRGRAAAGSTAAGVSLGSTFNVGNMSVQGQSSSGSGVSMNGANITTASGLIDIHGVTTRVDTTTAQLTGVDVGVADIQLGTGSLTIAGRGDDASLATTFGTATGVRFTDLRISAAANSTGTVTLAGQATGGSQANGLVSMPGGNAGLVISSLASTAGSPATGANVVIGASTSATASQAMTLDSTFSPRIATTGAVNYRPLGVSAAGAITEQAGVNISVLSPAAAASAPGGGFVVSSSLLQRSGSTNGSVAADKGIVIGSSAHTGLITVGDDALTQHGDVSLTLQNEGAGSQGIVLGIGNAVGSLGLLTTGNVTQTGALNVAQNLVIRGGAASNINLSNADNQIGVLAFDPPAVLNVTTRTDLTVDAATAQSFNAGTGTFAPLAITNSVGGNSVVLNSASNVLINRSISTTGTGTGTQLAIVANNETGRVTFAPGATLSLGAGRWQIWSPSVNGTLSGAAATNFYGCSFGDTTSCSKSGIAIPATGNQIFALAQPDLSVIADDITGTVGTLPTLTYSVSGLVNNDTAANALTGALDSTATPISPAGTYTVGQGTLTSPLGYTLTFQPGTLTLAAAAVVTNGNQSLDALGITREMLQSRFTSEMSSDVYGRNLSQPFVCTAASVVRGSVADGSIADPLSSEWGKVRNQPQLSGCLNVADGGQCSAF